MRVHRAELGLQTPTARSRITLGRSRGLATGGPPCRRTRTRRTACRRRAATPSAASSAACSATTRVIGDVVQLVRADNFYFDAHQKIFEAIIALYDKGQPGRPGHPGRAGSASRSSIEDVGGYAYLAELWDAAPTAANAEYYAQIVRDKAIVRNLIHASTEILRDAYDQAQPADELLEAAERKILDIAEMGITGQTITLHEALERGLRPHRRRARSGDQHVDQRHRRPASSISTT